MKVYTKESLIERLKEIRARGRQCKACTRLTAAAKWQRKKMKMETTNYQREVNSKEGASDE